MLILTKAVLSMMIGFAIAGVFGYLVIPLLKKNVKQRVSTYLEKKHAASAAIMQPKTGRGRGLVG